MVMRELIKRIEKAIERKKKIIWRDYYKKGSIWYGVEVYINGMLLVIFFPRKKMVWEIVFPFSFLSRTFFIWRIKNFYENEIKEFRFYSKYLLELNDDEKVIRGLEIRSEILDRIRRKRGYKRLIEDFMKFLEDKGWELMQRFPTLKMVYDPLS
jgi:hypothetical protein